MSSALSRRSLLTAAGAALPPLLFGGVGCRSAEPAAARVRSQQSDVRRVAAVIDAQDSMDGAGVRLRRSIGGRALSMLDPFLLLDEIRTDEPSEYLKGFPLHPHRGFETVTYMIDGAMEHRDSVGNRGRLVGGSVQWMTAGRGIVHSEMPQQERGLLWGFQLWVNLPRTHKLMAPRYQDIAPDRVPELSVRGSQIRLLAGALDKERGPVQGIAVEPTFLDVRLPAGARFEHLVPAEHGVFALVIDGAVEFGSDLTSLRKRQLAAFGNGAVFAARSASGGRFLLGAGRRLNEPVARRGPFVMNTEAEIEQAFADYQSGRLVSG
jgi:redox-sensitive bicupin YhaK (pirin superfamily)